MDTLHVDINRTASGSMRKALDFSDRPRHETAVEKKRRLGDKYDGAWVFSVVRNPYSRVVSQYKHRRDTDGADTFEEWVWQVYVKNRPTLLPDRRYFYKLFRPQAEWVCGPREGNLVDYIGRFEKLNEAWGTIKENTGAEGELPHMSRSEDERPWQSFYTEETAEIIRLRFERDFDQFGYKMDSYRH